MALIYESIPTFKYSKLISDLINQINDALTTCDDNTDKSIRTILRKNSHIKSIQSSIAIEGNTLSLLKIKDTINGKIVEGPFDEIVEAKNAIKAYDLIDKTEIMSVDCFLKIESIMMWGLVDTNGFRDGKVVITDGETIYYEPPEASQVPGMVEKLFDWCSTSGYPLYLIAAVAHYYIEAIHPFRDGNGRMGRYWHSAMLRKQSKVFRMVSIENAISRRQQDYYDILEKCQKKNDCTGFIEFMLELTLSSLQSLSRILEPRMSALLTSMGGKPMTSAQIMDRLGLKDRKHFQSEYLRPALECGFVTMTEPNSPHSPSQRYVRLVF